jgi:DNA repair protein RecO (recombination protein O)
VSPYSSDASGEAPTSRERRARLYNTHGIVLRRRDVGEADRIVTVYTIEHGKRSFSARGSRKTTSKIAGQIEPFSYTRFFVAQTRGLHIISQAQALNVFPKMREEERRIAIAGLFAELVDSLTPDDQENREVADLLIASLTLLDGGRDPLLVLIAFELGLMRHLGYRPELTRCGVCGRELTPLEHGFSLETGVVCRDCRRDAPSVQALSMDALKLMRAIDRGDLNALLHLRIDPRVTREADDLLAAYVERIVGKPSRAREVFRELRLQ